MYLFRSTVGRKILMALTGLVMLLYVSAHMLGNMSAFIGAEAMNAYAARIQGLGPLIWGARLALLVALYLHVFYGIQLTVENYDSKGTYSVRKYRMAIFASRNMIWTGSLIAVYLFYHLFHFTFGVIHPELFAGRNPDAAGRPDVFGMVILGFRHPAVSLIYIAAMVVLSFHLVHGIQSLFQTGGANSEKTMPLVAKAGLVAAIIISLGFISVPLAVFAGALRMR
jgi:succinate dehydrogenase / fumarate reductase cytochrome b subunit